MALRTSAMAATEVDEGYTAFEALLRDRIAAVEGPVFTTDVDPDTLWRTYLESIPADRRQHYNCACCRRFIQKYGGLVSIDKDGFLHPVLWCSDDSPPFFNEASDRLETMVMKAKVTGVFVWGPKEQVWGTPDFGGWTHLSGVPKRKHWTHPTLEASQKAAELKQDYQIISHSLADYSAEVVAQALRVLEAGAVYRSEKALAVAQWAADLHKRLDGALKSQQRNLIWLAVAEAPVGFCHLRSTVISTLLDDIKAGLPFDAISRRWAEKLHPLQYQRPTAPPKAGAIAEAEKLFDKMGAAASLQRRFATLADVLQKMWVPPQREPSPPKAGGLFDHLRNDKQPVKEIDLPATPVTMEKFRREVLPLAMELEVQAPHSGSYYGLVTAVHPDAPALLQWDGLMGKDSHWVMGDVDKPLPRNPVSWYFYNGGSPASAWNLSVGWVPVTAVFLSPHQWQQPDKFAHQGVSVHFALKGCWDARMSMGGSLCLFPETLRSEFHSVRSVIEAHSAKGRVQNPEEGTANGIAFSKGRAGDSSPLTVRVRTASGRATYRIDRWD